MEGHAWIARVRNSEIAIASLVGAVVTHIKLKGGVRWAVLMLCTPREKEIRGLLVRNTSGTAQPW
jgi:hypothetical protein